MKKLIGMFALMAIAIGAVAQTTPAKTDKKPSKETALYDAAIMKSGKVLLAKDNRYTALEKPVRLGESVVYPDGMVELNDGSKIELKEGDKVEANGNIIRQASMGSGNSPD